MFPGKVKAEKTATFPVLPVHALWFDQVNQRIAVRLKPKSDTHPIKVYSLTGELLASLGSHILQLQNNKNKHGLDGLSYDSQRNQFVCPVPIGQGGGNVALARVGPEDESLLNLSIGRLRVEDIMYQERSDEYVLLSDKIGQPMMCVNFFSATTGQVIKEVPVLGSLYNSGRLCKRAGVWSVAGTGHETDHQSSTILASETQPVQVTWNEEYAPEDSRILELVHCPWGRYFIRHDTLVELWRDGLKLCVWDGVGSPVFGEDVLKVSYDHRDWFDSLLLTCGHRLDTPGVATDPYLVLALNMRSGSRIELYKLSLVE